MSNAVVGEFPDPVPGPDEILLRVVVAANFVDLLVIGGKYQFLPELPFVPGKGPAGVVVDVGANVSNVSEGDRVLAMAEQGGYGQLVTAPAQNARAAGHAVLHRSCSMSLVYDTPGLRC